MIIKSDKYNVLKNVECFCERCKKSKYDCKLIISNIKFNCENKINEIEIHTYCGDCRRDYMKQLTSDYTAYDGLGQWDVQ